MEPSSEEYEQGFYTSSKELTFKDVISASEHLMQSIIPKFAQDLDSVAGDTCTEEAAVTKAAHDRFLENRFVASSPCWLTTQGPTLHKHLLNFKGALKKKYLALFAFQLLK